MRLYKPKLFLIVAIFVTLAGYAGVRISMGATSEPTTAGGGTDQILVRYKPNADTLALDTKLEQLDATVEEEVTSIQVKILKVPEEASDRVLRQLSADPRVEFAEPDAMVYDTVTTPNDTEYPQQWVWPKIRADALWDKARGSSSVVVAVSDSGINAAHPEFAGKLVPGYDFVNNDNTPDDDAGHGSWVAGVIGAVTNNSSGVASGCWNCRIMPIKTSAKLASGGSGGSVSNRVRGLEYAANNGAKIINLSHSFPTQSDSYKAAVDYAIGKGIVVVAAAGNDGAQPNPTQPRYPAGFANVISVAATDRNDVLTSYSNHGTHVDVAAPGEVRTVAGTGIGYATVNGTSFSSPIVSSIIATLISAFPKATVTDLTTAITKNTDLCCDGKLASGAGRLNTEKAYAFLAVKLGEPNPTPAPNPIPNPPPPTLPPNPPPTAPPNPPQPVPNPTPTKSGDVNGDNKVNITDASIIFSNWNKTGMTKAQGDINGDSKVNITDLSIVFSNWT